MARGPRNLLLVLCPLSIWPVYYLDNDVAAIAHLVIAAGVVPVMAYRLNRTKLLVAFLVTYIAVLSGYLPWGIYTGNLLAPDVATGAVLIGEVTLATVVLLIYFLIDRGGSNSQIYRVDGDT